MADQNEPGAELLKTRTVFIQSAVFRSHEMAFIQRLVFQSGEVGHDWAVFILTAIAYMYTGRR